jgi:hypothetical protein
MTASDYSMLDKPTVQRRGRWAMVAAEPAMPAEDMLAIRRSYAVRRLVAGAAQAARGAAEHVGVL